jgi:DNA-binding NtrC family response regulator
MWNDVLVVEDQSADSVAAWSGLLETADLAVRRRSAWSDFEPSQLSGCREKLIIVNAVPRTSEALDFFGWLQTHPLHTATFAILPPEETEFVRVAARAVDDFLFWPVRGEELRHRILRLLGPRSQEMEEIQRALVDQVGLENIVGTAPAFLQALSRVTVFGASDAPVLLTGETGTGKELFARVIHLLSRRRNGPFVPVECGCLPEHVFENEVFGHVRGAFTDAHTEQKGLVALARNGTLFLDEIDSLSPLTQGKLLRLLQEQTFRPLGSDQFCQANVRVIAASNRDLAFLVKEGRFRSDLFFRLDVLRVHLPPLRERPTDIAMLARHFAVDICAKNGLPRKVFVPSAIRKLESHIWPGNVRELYNAIHRAILASSGTEILPMHCDLARRDVAASGDQPDFASAPEGDFRSSKLRAIEQFERTYVERLLERFAGNVTRASGAAGKDRRAFGRLVKKYGLRFRP